VKICCPGTSFFCIPDISEMQVASQVWL